MKNNLSLEENLKKIYNKSLELPINNFTMYFDDLMPVECKKIFKRKIFPRTRIVKNKNIFELKFNKNLKCPIKIYEEEVLAILYYFTLEISNEELDYNNNINILKQDFINLYKDRISFTQPFIGLKINNVEYLGYSEFLENLIKNIFINLKDLNSLDSELKIEFLESGYKGVTDTFFETFIYFELDGENFEEEKIIQLLSLNCENDKS